MVDEVQEKTSIKFFEKSSQFSRLRHNSHYQDWHANSCFLFSKKNPVRRLCTLVVGSRMFEGFMLAVIAANCVTLAMAVNSPGFNDSETGKVLNILENVFLALFTVEAILKIISYGFVSGEGTYLRNGWNVLDITIVVLGYAAFFIPSNFTVARAVRALRPLRTVSRIKELKVLVVSCISAIPMLCDVVALACFIFFVAGIISMNIFGGVLSYRCALPDFSNADYVHNGSNVMLLTNVTYNVDDTQTVCAVPYADQITWYDINGTLSPQDVYLETQGYVCPWYGDSGNYTTSEYCVSYANPELGQRHFDDILYSWLAIYQIVTLSDWEYIMYDTQNALTIWTFLFFIIMVVLLAFFLVNLFVAVIYRQYIKDFQGEGGGTRSTRKMSANSLPALTSGIAVSRDNSLEEPSKWKKVQEKMQSFMGPIVNHHAFEWLTISVIVVNGLFLVAQWNGMPQYWVTASTDANYGFTFFFVCEMLAKWAGLGIGTYFKKKANWFDCLIVVASVTETGVELSPLTSTFGQSLSVLRAFRLLRLLALAKSWRSMQHIVRTLVRSVQSMAYLSLLMLLFIFVLALLGMQLFGYQLDSCSTDNATQLCMEASVFDCPAHWDCYVACNASIVDTWFSVPTSPYGGQAYCQGFSPAGTVEYWAQVGKASTYQYNFDDIYSACLSVFQLLTLDNMPIFMHTLMYSLTPWAALYFVTVTVIGNYIILNLFLAILLENFAVTLEELQAEAALETSHSVQAISTLPDNRTLRTFDSFASEAPSEPASTHPELEHEHEPEPSPASLFIKRGSSEVKVEAPAALLAPRSEERDRERRTYGKVLLTPIRTENEPPEPPDEPEAPTVLSSEPAAERKPVEVTGDMMEGIGVVPVEPTEHSGTVLKSGLKGGLKGGLKKEKKARRVRVMVEEEEDTPVSSGENLRVVNRQPSMFRVQTLAQSFYVTPNVQEGILKELAAKKKFKKTVNAVAASAKLMAIRKALAGGVDGKAAEGVGKPKDNEVDKGEKLPKPSRPPLFGNASVAPAPSETPESPAKEPPIVTPFALALRNKQMSVDLFEADRGSNESGYRPSESGYRPSECGSMASESGSASPVSRHRWKQRTTSSGSEVPEHASRLHRMSMDRTSGSSVTSRMASALSLTQSTELTPHRRRSLLQRFTASINEVRQIDVSILLSGNSLNMFSNTNPIRRACAKIIISIYFDPLILVIIVLSSITLAIDSPLLNQDGSLHQTLNILDMIFTFCFVMEALLKIIMHGLAFNGRNSYIRSPWNILDLFIVSSSVIVVGLELAGLNANHLSWLRAVRALRALRPLRAASRIPGMKVVVAAVFKALPALVQVWCVAVLFYIIFAVLYMNLTMGMLFYCQDSSGNMLDPYYYLAPGQTMTQEWCEAGTQLITNTVYFSEQNLTFVPYNLTGISWINYPLNFDNVGDGIWTLFQFATQSGWTNTMYQTSYAVGVGQQPIVNNNRWICVISVLFIIIGTFFMLNLVIGVTIDKFNEVKQAEGGASPLLTPKQQEWVTIQRMVAITKPKVVHVAPTNPLRRAIYDIIEHRFFDYLVMGVIVTNMIIMALYYQGESLIWKDVLDWFNVGFTAFFVLEMVLKWIGLSLPVYYSEAWNCFDCAVVCVSVAGVVVEMATPTQLAIAPIFRILRVVRIFRLIPRVKGLRVLMMTLFWSLPAIVNVGSVLVLFMIIYAVVGMNLFAFNLFGPECHEYANFQYFANSMLALFRVLTLDNWNNFMYDFMVTTNCIQILTTYPNGTAANGYVPVYVNDYFTPGDPLLAGISDNDQLDQCALSPYLTSAFFYSYIILVSYLLLQLVIGVMLETYASIAYTEELRVNESDISRFVRAWQELDPQSTSYINALQLTTLLHELKPQLGVQGMSNPTKAVQDIVLSTEIPCRDGRLHFVEVLHALGSRVAGIDIPEAEQKQIRKMLALRLPPKDKAKYLMSHYYSAMVIQTRIRGFLLRDQLHKKKMDLALKERASSHAFHSSPTSPGLSDSPQGGAHILCEPVLYGKVAMSECGKGVAEAKLETEEPEPDSPKASGTRFMDP